MVLNDLVWIGFCVDSTGLVLYMGGNRKNTSRVWPIFSPPAEWADAIVISWLPVRRAWA